MGAVPARLPVWVSPFGPLHPLVMELATMTVSGRAPETLAGLERLEPYVLATGDRRTLAFVLQTRMYALLALGRLQEALPAGEALLALQREFGSRVGEAKAAADLAETRIRMGRIDEGLRELAWATALLGQCWPTTQRYAAAMSSAGEAAKAAELYELADSMTQEMLASPALAGADRLAAELQHAELLLEWGLRLHHLGQLEEAEARLRHTAELADRVLAAAVIPARAPLATGILAAALAKLGDLARAEKLAEDLIVPARQAGQFHEARLGHLAYGIALRAAGDYPGARRELLAADELAAPAGNDTVRMIFQFELALCAATQFPDAARDLLPIMRSHAQQRWNARLERRWLLRSAHARAELEADRARADEAAYRDPLTGLGNRRRFEQQMLALEPDAGPLSLILIDTDNFKTVNDTYSHAVGDRVLRGVAEVVGQHCRPDDVAVRFGGDEFAVFLRADRGSAARVAERIRRAVATCDWTALSPGLAVTLSIGVAERAAGMTTSELFDAADLHLYAAKRRGRNRLAVA